MRRAAGGRWFEVFLASHVLSSYLALTLGVELTRAGGNDPSGLACIGAVAPVTLPLIATNLLTGPSELFGRRTLVLVGVTYVATFYVTAVVLRWRQRRRATRPSGWRYCSHCGYDLRATPERGPECGGAAGSPSV